MNSFTLTRIRGEDARRWGAVEGVEPVGPVDDIAAEYRRCAFAVAPVFDGGGTKIKVLEALAHGRACLTTPHASQGFADHLQNGESQLVADVGSFAEGAIALFADASLREALAQRGFDTVRGHYTFDALAAVVAETVEETVTRMPGGVRQTAEGG